MTYNVSSGTVNLTHSLTFMFIFMFVNERCVCEGDLKTFLLSRRQMVGQNTKEAEDVSPAGLTQMALDVAHGLQYLSQLKYVHR